jgi:hypothetical protein
MKAVVIILLSFGLCKAQERSSTQLDLSKVADEFFGYQEIDENTEERLDNIVQLLNNPLNLNTATQEDFRFLSFLSETQI